MALLDERGKFKSHVFANDAKGHALLIAWLLDRAGAATLVRVCMEGTGPYGEACATALDDAGFVVSVVKPARVRGFAQSELVRDKTDRADAALQARFGQTMQPEPWVTPPPEVRELRALVDRLHSLKEMHQQEANRLESAMNQPGARGKALVAFIGVTPRLTLSGSSVRGRSMFSRSGHAQVRHSLHMQALVALRHNPLVSVFGIRMKAAGLAPKAVISACMHKLVLLVYGILKSRQPFNPNFGANRLYFQDGI